MKKKIGLLGGSFNPIHTGHLLLAESARDQYELDKVLFIPTGNNPFKLSQDEIAREHRLKMVELAIAGNDSFEILTHEIDQNGITYTIDTINIIKEIYPDLFKEELARQSVFERKASEGEELVNLMLELTEELRQETKGKE